MKKAVFVLALVVVTCVAMGSAEAARYGAQFDGMNSVVYWVLPQAQGIPGAEEMAGKLNTALFTELRAKLPRVTACNAAQALNSEPDAEVQLVVFLAPRTYEEDYMGYYGDVELNVRRKVTLAGKEDAFYADVYSAGMILTGGSCDNPVDHIEKIIPDLVQQFAADLYEARSDL